MDDKNCYKHTNNSFHFFFLIFIAIDVGGVHENVYDLKNLHLKFKYAFRKICMIDDTKNKLTFSPYYY